MKKETAHWFFRARESCFAALAITSAIVIYQGVTGRLDWLPSYHLAMLIGAAAAFIFYLAIDGPLSSVLPSFFDERTAKNWKERKAQERAFVSWVGLVAFILLFITGTLSWWSSYIIADGLVKDPDHSSLLSTISTESERHERNVERLEAELANARRTEGERVRTATERLEAAKFAGREKWGREFSNHYAYAATLEKKGRLTGSFGQWYMGIKAAEEELEAERTKAERLAANVQDMRTNGTNAQTSYLSTLATIGQNQDVHASFMRQIWSNVFIILDIIFAMGSVFFTYLLSKYENLYGKIITEAPFSLVGVLNETFRSVAQTSLGFFSRRILRMELAIDRSGANGANADEGERSEETGGERGANERTAEMRTNGNGGEGEPEERVRVRRAKSMKAAGWSYGDIAKELGVSKSTAHKYVNGK